MLVRADGAGCNHQLLAWLHGQRFSYSVGYLLPGNTAELLQKIP